MKTGLLVIITLLFHSVLIANDLVILEKLPSKDIRSEGLVYHDGYLWQSVGYTSKILKIDPTDGHIIDTFDSPAKYCEGLVWINESLWHVDYYSNKIFRGKLSGSSIIFNPVAKTKEPTAFGLAKNANGDLILTGKFSSYLYILDVSTLEISNEIKTEVPGLEDITFDGKYLWASSYNNRTSVYAIDLSNGKTVKEFSLPSCPRIDGIAYHDEKLYITGKEKCNWIFVVERPDIQSNTR